MSENTDRVKSLTAIDNKSLLEMTLKTSEEVGELAEAVLVIEAAPGTGYKKLKRDAVLEEAADVAICALSVAFKAGYSEEEFNEMVRKKLDKWSEVLNLT